MSGRVEGLNPLPPDYKSSALTNHSAILTSASVRPGQVIVLSSWAKHFTFTVPISIQEYKWALVNCQGGLVKCWEGKLCDELASHPGEEGVVPFLSLDAEETRISSD